MGWGHTRKLVLTSGDLESVKTNGMDHLAALFLRFLDRTIFLTLNPVESGALRFLPAAGVTVGEDSFEALLTVMESAFISRAGVDRIDKALLADLVERVDCGLGLAMIEGEIS